MERRGYRTAKGRLVGREVLELYVWEDGGCPGPVRSSAGGFRELLEWPGGELDGH